jgi:hypothetical protein
MLIARGSSQKLIQVTVLPTEIVIMLGSRPSAFIDTSKEPGCGVVVGVVVVGAGVVVVVVVVMIIVGVGVIVV